MTKAVKEVQTFDVTEANLNKALADVKKDPVYGSDLKVLEEAFKKCPENTDENVVAKKIALVDLTHSTNLFRHRNNLPLEAFAKHIAGIENFDKRVKEGDLTLVEEIAKNGKVNLMSFASKYCQLHNSLLYGRDDYSKYDNIVCRVLPHYVKNVSCNRLRTTIRNNYDYCEFMSIIDTALKDVNAENKRMKFDYLMWYYNRGNK